MEEEKKEIGQLLYRSRASNPMTTDELRGLLHQARERNASENLTGLLVHDRDRFVQWLEGPAASLDRVWTSILNDSRHCDLERLHVPRLKQRIFPDWDMQLGHDGDGGVTRQGDPDDFEELTLPDSAMKNLREHRIDAHEIVRGVSFWHAIPPLPKLVEQLTRGTEEEVQALFDLILELHPSIHSLAWHLFGPVARALGDAWQEDQIAGAELVIAQTRLCELLRTVSRERLEDDMPWRDGLVLVVPMPGENAMAGASFTCIAFEALGWNVEWAFLQQHDELLEKVKRTNYVIVHLELSDSFMHEQALPELANFIQRLRQVSANPDVKVLVGGRVFSAQPGLSVMIGADGDAVSRGSEAKDIEAMLEFKGWNKPMDPLMVAQATLLDVCQHIQQRHFEKSK